MGESCLLDAGDEITLGRGSDCTIIVDDSLCSRVHARLKSDQGAWTLSDAGSRNGTYVNGSKIDECRLSDGAEIRLGSTEFSFQEAEQPLTVGLQDALGVTQTVVLDVPIRESVEAATVREGQRAEEITALYQLSVDLLRKDQPDEVGKAAVEVLRNGIGASVAGFLWTSDDGDLKPRIVSPQQAVKHIKLASELTQLVSKEQRALWVADQRSQAPRHTPEHFADALCVPLVHGGRTLGAIHAYLDHGRFRQSDLEFAIAAANIAVLALVRAQREATLVLDNEQLLQKAPGRGDLIGESKPMLELKSKIARVAKATGAVLIRGESGSGKELVARAVHRNSPRKDRPLVCVNCAAIPADLMESQLFGHKAGSFTGAAKDHQGFFQQADMGTLFLDEVGEMTLDGQAKLLRILEGHPFQRVGGVEEIQVDVRVIAATNRDLQDFVREKRFREDLYYRLSVFELQVPPLRNRGDDVALLVEFFLDHYRRQHGRPELNLSPKALLTLTGYFWPGNVRQLRNVIDSAVVLAEGPEIRVDDLNLRSAGEEELESLRLDHWEEKLIREALQRTKGSIPEATKLLGVSRATLYRKIDEYNIER